MTHIATVMRYPLPGGRNHPATGVQLRLRLPDNLAEEAKALAFVLPGQSRFRGHQDYRARPLTDAVLTAISLQQDFSDEVLDGIRPRLRHEAARGLWQLVVLSSLSSWEAEILDSSRREYRAREAQAKLRIPTGPISRTSRVAAELFEQNISWHNPERNKLAGQIARELLSGSDSETIEKRLFDHNPMDPNWAERLGRRRSHYVASLPTAAGPSTLRLRFEGRGAGATWRARRSLTLEEIRTWLIDAGAPAATCTVQAPGWELRIPPGWRPLIFDSRTHLPDEWSEHLSNSRVLDLAAGSRRVLWPTVEKSAGPAPVPGVDTFLTTAHTHPKARNRPLEFLVEVLLRQLEEPTESGADDMGKALGDDGIVDLPGYLQEELYETVLIPARRAHALGLITGSEQDRLIDEAEAWNDARVQKVVDSLRAHSETRVRTIAAKLEAVKRDPVAFSRILRDYDGLLEAYNASVSFSYMPAAHPWPITSLADVIADGASTEVLSWLTGFLVSRTARLLERSMELTARQAFDTVHPVQLA